MLAWLLFGDGEIEEIEVDVDGVLLLPDDKLIREIEFVEVLSGLVNDDSSSLLTNCQQTE